MLEHSPEVCFELEFLKRYKRLGFMDSVDKRALHPKRERILALFKAFLVFRVLVQGLGVRV